MMAWRCKSWNALPEAGGMMDQDARLMYRMGVLERIYKTIARYRSMRGEQIHTLTDGERDILRWLIKIGAWNG